MEIRCPADVEDEFAALMAQVDALGYLVLSMASISKDHAALIHLLSSIPTTPPDRSVWPRNSVAYRDAFDSARTQLIRALEAMKTAMAKSPDEPPRSH